MRALVVAEKKLASASEREKERDSCHLQTEACRASDCKIKPAALTAAAAAAVSLWELRSALVSF